MLIIIRAALAAGFALVGLLVPIGVWATHGGSAALLCFVGLQAIGAMLAPAIPA